MRSTRPQDNSMLVVSWRHRGVLRYCNVFHQEVHRQKQSTSTPTKKMWINSDVRAALSARISAFKSGNTDNRKQASYDLRRSIKAAKRTYKNKVEEQFNTNNPRSMWQGINNITGFKGNKPATLNIATSLSLINVMLVSRLTTPPTQRALPWLLQKRWVHSPFPSRM